MKKDILSLIDGKEKILYEGKPNKKCFVLESIFNPLLPVALLWGLFDVYLIFNVFKSTGEDNTFFLIFFIIHLMPVWIYLFGIFTIFLKFRNAYYIITDFTIYVSNGIFTKQIVTKQFNESFHVDVKRGIFDQLLGVGDVVIDDCVNEMQHRQNVSLQIKGIKIIDIVEYNKVYNLIKKMQKDRFADTMYPNAYRPNDDKGYNI